MTSFSLDAFYAIDKSSYTNEQATLSQLINYAGLSQSQRNSISEQGAQWVEQIRQQAKPSLMDVFLSEYGLSSREGVALMCLAEALLRVPDARTIDALIEDKITANDWASHLGQSSSSLVNSATRALIIVQRLVYPQRPTAINRLIKPLAQPLVRMATRQAMKTMGHQFVLGQTITSALKRARKQQAKGYCYSYDMLGEAALTAQDAERYLRAYTDAIQAIGQTCEAEDIRDNPGISVKLSALFPRYELAQRERVLAELVPSVVTLARLAKEHNMSLTIDAEEADRLSLSLEVIRAVLSEPELAGWDGFGVVVQAYGQRAGSVIENLYQFVTELDRHITVRLVKGAYWDSEIKQAQVKGMEGFAVFTSKAATDVSYIANAKRLLSMTDRIFPQFATHNAHTMAAILQLAPSTDCFEFQRLHGMGESLHELVKSQNNSRCRIYAPVGAHRDLLAYLVRRLLENGANSSFVNQINDSSMAAAQVAQDPFTQLDAIKKSSLPTGRALFLPERINSAGWDLNHRPTLNRIEQARAPFAQTQWHARSILAVKSEQPSQAATALYNPAKSEDQIGSVQYVTEHQITQALGAALPWSSEASARAKALNAVADLYEQHFAELFALLCREAGKTLADAVAEVREAVDFLRYYANEIKPGDAVGTFVCVSPWNFPLAIFTGQIAAALAAGNAVLAKPAPQTPLIAWRAVQLMHSAGVPVASLQLLLGDAEVGAQLCEATEVDGVCFTGSTQTAKKIYSSMAQHLKPGAPLIAETGGLNAMIIDSTALLEQAVTAVIESAFQSAGQRCSALRCLYVQEDIVEQFTEMLFGAMDELNIGDPWKLSTDIGPLIDRQAAKNICDYIDRAERDGRLIKRLSTAEQGHFVAPAVIKVTGISELTKEVFGPVLHLASFKNHQLDQIINDINATGYGLTFGLQTRIDQRIKLVSERILAGNVYVNRNQIGAVVGSQPFGGHGLSGTGPKAGGPHYLARFYKQPVAAITLAQLDSSENTLTELSDFQRQIDQQNNQRINPHHSHSVCLPGPTGESNRLILQSREPVLCLGPNDSMAQQQAEWVRQLGGNAVVCCQAVRGLALLQLMRFSAVIWWGDEFEARRLSLLLASREGALLPLITGIPDIGHVLREQQICIDTTASGGNTELLSAAQVIQ